MQNLQPERMEINTIAFNNSEFHFNTYFQKISLKKTFTVLIKIFLLNGRHASLNPKTPTSPYCNFYGLISIFK